MSKTASKIKAGAVFTIIAAFLLLPEGVNAEKKWLLTIAVDELQFNDSDPGMTIFKKTAQGISAETKGLIGNGIINCSQNPICLGAGIEGKTLTIAMDLKIIIDVISAGIKGSVRGLVVVENFVVYEFRGRVEGKTGNLGDDTFLVSMNVTASTKNGGRIYQKLLGTLTRDGWTGLGGFLTLKLDADWNEQSQ